MVDKKLFEQRQNVRVVISTRARVKLVDSEQFECVRVLRKSIASDQKADKKLNSIIETLHPDEGEEEHKIKVKETIDVSGSGLRMILSESIEVGQILHISLRMPGFSLGTFQTYGEVVRIKPRKGIDEGLFDVGIQFLDLSEEEREGLIAYTFYQQRKLIRQSMEDD